MIKRTLEVTKSNSNNKYSPFYDPKYTMSITVNGQLSLSMLMEKVVQKFNARLVCANTDGFEFIIDRNKFDQVEDLVRKWEQYVGLQMELAIYDHMYLRDVNN